MKEFRVSRDRANAPIPWPVVAVKIAGEKQLVRTRCVSRATLNVPGVRDETPVERDTLRAMRKERRRRAMRLRLRRGRR